MSNPITSAIPSSSPITSVSPQTYSSPLSSSHQQGHGHGNNQLLSRLHLDLRGQMFTVDRETLMLLPESVLLGLFPQGLVLSKPAGGGWGNGNGDGDEEGVVAVDFDPSCFAYILSFWSSATSTFYGTPTSSGRFHLQSMLAGPEGSFHPSSAAGEHQNPLLIKQAIIVLREELEYFSITKPGGLARTDIGTGQPNDELRFMRRAAGKALEEKRTIFTALQRNVNKENNLAEQHLIDMLCMSGFNREDEWGYRACEPNRNIISSMALVLLKTGLSHPGDADYDQEGYEGADGEVKMDAMQMATAQKLLLFWRKPARKCWWDGVEVDVPVSSTSKETHRVKVWARRVWTLELSLVQEDVSRS